MPVAVLYPEQVLILLLVPSAVSVGWRRLPGAVAEAAEAADAALPEAGPELVPAEAEARFSTEPVELVGDGGGSGLKNTWRMADDHLSDFYYALTSVCL